MIGTEINKTIYNNNKIIKDLYYKNLKNFIITSIENIHFKNSINICNTLEECAQYCYSNIINTNEYNNTLQNIFKEYNIKDLVYTTPKKELRLELKDYIKRDINIIITNEWIKFKEQMEQYFI